MLEYSHIKIYFFKQAYLYHLFRFKNIFSFLFSCKHIKEGNMTKKTNVDKTEIEAGKRIRSLMAERNMIQKDLELDVWKGRNSQSRVSKIVNGNEHFSFRDLVEAAEYFGVSTDYLLGLTDQKTASSSTEKKPITAKKFCEALLNLLDSSFPWTLIEVPCKETVLTEFNIEYEQTFSYPAIYFKEYRGYSYQLYTDEDGTEQYGLRENTNKTPSKINSFIRKAVKYRKWLNDSDMDIDREEYEDFLEKQLSKLSE